VLVAGAGVVGMACARALQRAGYRVCVVDPAPPGSVCSYGNAGVIAADHILPLARPETLARLPAMLLDRRGPLYLKASRVPGLLPWMFRFAAACGPTRVAQGIQAMAALTSRSVTAWRSELEASGAQRLLENRGMYSVYPDPAALDRDAAARDQARSLGVDWEIIDGGELRRREPALGDSLSGAVYYPQVAHVLDPQAVVTALAAAFTAADGSILQRAVVAIDSLPHELRITLTEGRLRARYAVVAAGLGSRALCRDLGWEPPLVAEMGYHLTFPGEQQRLSAPVSADGFIVTPMTDHLRVAGTVELARREVAPTWQRAAMLRPLADRVFREPLPAASGRWRGSRPSLPDFLPAIGPLPGQPRIIAAFGHQHIGLTTAAVTGALVRDMVRGRAPEIDVAPYSPGRFAAPWR
jgi:D-hydroxyproline dehydrogenase